MKPRVARTGLATAALLAGVLVVVPGASAARQVVNPVADAYVRADRATGNFGTSTTLQVDGSPVWNAYLRFTVSIPAGESVTKASLRLYTTQSSGSGFSVHGVPDSTWGETTITFSNAPAIGATVGSSASYRANTYVEVVVTPLVTGSGPVSMAVKRSSNASNAFRSREATANKPQLVVDTAPAADTTPPDTTISAGPSGATSDSTPAFEFTSTETPSTFACRVDAGAFAACSSPHTTAALADGAHTFDVRARDAAGNLDATPASRGFTVATATPQPAFPIRATFYYPWFPEAWNQSGINPFTKYNPSLGFYSSASDDVRDSHLRSLTHGKFEAGIYSWWGQGSKEDTRFPGMLARTSATGSPLKWALYHEREGNGADPSVAELQSDLDYIKARYAADPAYLKVGGKPVIFVYAAAGDGSGMADRWHAANDAARDFYVVLKVFAGYRTVVNQPESWHQYAPALRSDRQAGYAFVISPEFDLTGPDPPRLARDLGAFREAIRTMVASGDPWQLVTTFNEWGENSATESAQEWSTTSSHGQYLDALNTDGQ